MAGFLFDPLLSLDHLQLTCGKTPCLFIPALRALADSGRIKQRKNVSYRVVLKGIDEIDRFT